MDGKNQVSKINKKEALLLAQLCEIYTRDKGINLYSMKFLLSMVLTSVEKLIDDTEKKKNEV